MQKALITLSPLSVQLGILHDHPRVGPRRLTEGQITWPGKGLTQQFPNCGHIMNFNAHASPQSN